MILNEGDVYRLKYILKKISDAEFIKLHYNLVKVNMFFFLSPIYFSEQKGTIVFGI